jgi:hypothetical protein
MHEEMILTRISPIRRVLDEDLRACEMGCTEDLGHATHKTVGPTEFAQMLRWRIRDARGRSGSAEHGRTLSIGRSEVRDESGDGEGAAGRSGYDGQELTGDGTLEEFGIEGVACEIRSIATPLAGVVVNQLHRKTKSSQENR